MAKFCTLCVAIKICREIRKKSVTIYSLKRSLYQRQYTEYVKIQLRQLSHDSPLKYDFMQHERPFGYSYLQNKTGKLDIKGHKIDVSIQ